jgi:hypothetical protein
MPHPLTEDQLRGIYIDRLYGYVSRRCGGDRALAKDVTQETWPCAVREWRNKGVPEVPLGGSRPSRAICSSTSCESGSRSPSRRSRRRS